MKKLLFGLIATVFFGMSANAQEVLKEKVENDLINGSISFYNSVSSFYKAGMTEKDFFNSLSNEQGFDNQSTEAKNVLSVAYKLLTNKASNDQVKKDLYKPFTLLTNKSLQLVYSGEAENLDQASAILFGVNNDILQTKLSTKSKGPNGEVDFKANLGCRWYQIGCHLNWLFNTKDGRDTLKAIIEVATLIIKFL